MPPNISELGLTISSAGISIGTFGGAVSYNRSSVGSLKFTVSNSYLSAAPSNDWSFGTNDFTIEWWQYQTAAPGAGAHQFIRVFTVDEYPTIDLGVSIESSNTLYFWAGGGSTPITNRTLTSYISAWTHIAITRSGTNLKIFANGTQLGATVSNSTNIVANTKNLYIGADAAAESNTRFPGYITNFRMVKGAAIYTSNFTPSFPLQSTSETSLLLLASNNADRFKDSSNYNRTIVTAGNTTWSSLTPT